MNSSIPGKQYFKCANKPSAKLQDLKGFDCPLWEINGDHKGSFNEASYKITRVNDNLVALCPTCYYATNSKEFIQNKYLTLKGSNDDNDLSSECSSDD